MNSDMWIANLNPVLETHKEGITKIITMAFWFYFLK